MPDARARLDESNLLDASYPNAAGAVHVSYFAAPARSTACGEQLMINHVERCREFDC